MAEHVLTLDCPEAPGIVHAVSRFLLDHGSDIVDNQQFGDRRSGHFFMRVRFAAPDGEETTERLRRDFEPNSPQQTSPACAAKASAHSPKPKPSPHSTPH
ncbi:ACT domain-containing protein, partial [Streptomyces sp. NPDC002851]